MIPSYLFRASLFAFIQNQCEKYHIDESHGLIHSKRCVKWADKMILSDQETWTDSEKTVAIYSAAVHDLVDKKYVLPFDGLNDLRNWFFEQSKENMDLNEETIEAILSIIQTMSYSFLTQRKYVDGKIWYPDHGKWSKSYHIARQADLLEGYHVGRCYMYSKHAYPEIKEKELWEMVERLFKKRMYKYVSDGWIHHSTALASSITLVEEAHMCFETHIWEYQV